MVGVNLKYIDAYAASWPNNSKFQMFATKHKVNNYCNLRFTVDPHLITCMYIWRSYETQEYNNKRLFFFQSLKPWNTAWREKNNDVCAIFVFPFCLHKNTYRPIAGIFHVLYVFVQIWRKDVPDITLNNIGM